MFGSSSTDANSGSSILPNVFQEDTACAQICPNLSYNQRVIGFFACCGIGFLLSLIGTLTLIGGTNPDNIRTFVALFLVGTIISLCSTGFLLGPKSQCNKMWHPSRRWSTAFYLAMIIIVFGLAVGKQHVALVLFFLAIEILAATWYGLSYIPFGRKICLEFFRSIGICFPCFFVYDQVYEATKSQGGSGSTGSSISSSLGMSKSQSNPAAENNQSSFFGGSKL